jgi:L-ascorbate metabolism protein UlaG (beta-lactamase superfamily)
LAARSRGRFGDEEGHDARRGRPAGFIIQLENGFKIYHMGETGLFGDMKLISDYYKPDLILMPIGGHFVMDPQDAAYATKEWLKPKFVIPMHYGTTPVLKGTPQEYMAALGQTTTKVFPINPGGSAGVLGCRGLGVSFMRRVQVCSASTRRSCRR